MGEALTILGVITVCGCILTSAVALLRVPRAFLSSSPPLRRAREPERIAS